MASAQQKMEDYANQSRAAPVTLKKDDLVWLNLRNIETPQPSKKLSWINSKYRVTKVISPYVVKLDVPTGIFLRFHVDLLKRAAKDPLPSQITDNVQPPPLVPQSEDQDEEFQVERILRAKKKRVGRGSRREVLVKWTGYAEPSWHPRSDFEDTEALEEFEKRFGKGDSVGEEDQEAITEPKKPTRRKNPKKATTSTNVICTTLILPTPNAYKTDEEGNVAG